MLVLLAWILESHLERLGLRPQAAKFQDTVACSSHGNLIKFPQLDLNIS